MANDFRQTISAWVHKVEKQGQAIVDECIDETLRRVKDRTPVATGALQAAWTVERSGKYKTVIHNPLPYAKVVEYGLYPNPPKKGTGKTVNGFSTQAPAGMVGITVAEWPQIVAEAVQKVGK